MANLLYLNASPRGAASVSATAADIAVAAIPAGWTVTPLELFAMDLPEVTSEVTAAKFKSVMGAPLEDEEARQWQQVTTLVQQFLAADAYVLAVPMWNFGLPYKLKHYIDAINHPGLTFTRDASGPRGLASGPALLVYGRGGDYSPKDGQPDPLDFQSTYLKAWLGTIGITEVTEVAIQNTMAGPEAVAGAITEARPALEGFARQLAG